MNARAVSLECSILGPVHECMSNTRTVDNTSGSRCRHHALIEINGLIPAMLHFTPLSCIGKI